MPALLSPLCLQTALQHYSALNVSLFVWVNNIFPQRIICSCHEFITYAARQTTPRNCFIWIYMKLSSLTSTHTLGHGQTNTLMTLYMEMTFRLWKKALTKLCSSFECMCTGMAFRVYWFDMTKQKLFQIYCLSIKFFQIFLAVYLHRISNNFLMYRINNFSSGRI